MWPGTSRYRAGRGQESTCSPVRQFKRFVAGRVHLLTGTSSRLPTNRQISFSRHVYRPLELGRRPAASNDRHVLEFDEQQSRTMDLPRRQYTLHATPYYVHRKTACNMLRILSSKLHDDAHFCIQTYRGSCATTHT